MSVIKYKDPNTGEVKKVGFPKMDLYDKGEVDDLLKGKANAEHTHTKSQITDFAHSHEMTDVNGLNSALSEKASAANVYTKTESDTLLSKKPNPNLLDNWYFGNPVDQRGGYVVPPNTSCFGIDQTSGEWKTDNYYTVESFYTYNGVEYGRFSANGGTYATNKTMCVRGYTGAGYGIDRWNMNGDTSTILLQDGVVELVLGMGYQTLNQDIENPLNFRGKTVTASILVESLDGGSFHLMAYDGAGYYGYNTRITTPGVHSITFAVDGNATLLRILLQNRSETETATVKVQAAKLELGTTQTLAHQDANGNWVRNEIPDYGEQLARCQRYLFSAHDPLIPYACVGSGYITNDGTTAIIIIPLPVALRAIPSVIVKGKIRIDMSNGNIGFMTAAGVYNIGRGCIAIYGAVTNGTAGVPCYALLDVNDDILLSAEL